MNNDIDIIEKKVFNIKQKNILVQGIFGNKDVNRKDTDIIFILNEADTLQLCLHNILNLINEIYKWKIENALFTPTFELQSILKSNNESRYIHILIYPSYWSFLKHESKPIVKHILTVTNNKQLLTNSYYKLNIKPKKYFVNYYDILQKIINSLVLLLNKDKDNQKIIQIHAKRVLLYSIKWLPIKNKNLMLKKHLNKKMSFEEVIAIYFDISNGLLE